MTRKLYLLPLVFVSHQAVAQGPEDFIGSFKGSEDVVITCSNAAWNKTENRSWTSTHKDLNGDSFRGLTRTGGGQYDVKGTINGNIATGTFKGKDGFGNPCNGEFTDTLNGDELTVISNGKCPTVGCEFSGQVKAKKQ